MKFAKALFVPLVHAAAVILFISLVSTNSPSQTKAGGDDYVLTDLEKAVLEEMNLARTRPAEYATYLEAQRKYYNGKEYKQPGRAIVDTIEGVSALEDAIKYLRASTPLPPLQISRGMCLGAKDQSFDQSKTGDVSHQGSDKSFSWERVSRYGDWKTPVSENIAYDDGAARDVVINLIVDDGVPTRGHRLNIFNSSYIVTGIACGKHPLFGNMCVCTFAGGFTEKAMMDAKPATSTDAKTETKVAKPAARKL